jgi:pilus assembly protein CpaD
VLLPACEEHRGPDDAVAVGLGKPELRHPIHFTAHTEVLDVEVPEGVEGLSANQHIDVYRFLDRYKREAKGRLVITAPAGPRDPASIAHSLRGIQRHVAEAGIDYRLTRTAKRRAADIPVIRLLYRRPVAVPPVCDKWGEDVGRNEARVPYPNFGCATQRNFAIMVDNARDLLRPQDEDPRASERRSVLWSGYAGGKAASEGNVSGGGEAGIKPPPAVKK